MKCREDNEGQMPQLQGDNTHETMEVNSFCNKQATTLNTRVVQVSIVLFLPKVVDV